MKKSKKIFAFLGIMLVAGAAFIASPEKSATAADMTKLEKNMATSNSLLQEGAPDELKANVPCGNYMCYGQRCCISPTGQSYCASQCQ